MLTIKDLTASKELDSKEMAGVTGGHGIPASFLANIGSPVNAPKFAELLGMAKRRIMAEDSNTTINPRGKYRGKRNFTTTHA